MPSGGDGRRGQGDRPEDRREQDGDVPSAPARAGADQRRDRPSLGSVRAACRHARPSAPDRIGASTKRYEASAMIAVSPKPDDQQGGRIQGQVEVGPGQREDRPVPQVDAVRAGPDPAHRAAVEQRTQPAPRVDRGGDHRDRRQRHQRQPTSIQERLEGIRPDEEGCQHGEPRQPRKLDEPADAPAGPDPGLARPVLAGRDLRHPDERQRGAQQQAGQAGVGAVVEARRIAARVEQEGHPGGRTDRAGQGQRQAGRAARPPGARRGPAARAGRTAPRWPATRGA